MTHTQTQDSRSTFELVAFERAFGREGAGILDELRAAERLENKDIKEDAMSLRYSLGLIMGSIRNLREVEGHVVAENTQASQAHRCVKHEINLFENLLAHSNTGFSHCYHMARQFGLGAVEQPLTEFILTLSSCLNSFCSDDSLQIDFTERDRYFARFAGAQRFLLAAQLLLTGGPELIPEEALTPTWP